MYYKHYLHIIFAQLYFRSLLIIVVHDKTKSFALQSRFANKKAVIHLSIGKFCCL